MRRDGRLHGRLRPVARAGAGPGTRPADPRLRALMTPPMATPIATATAPRAPGRLGSPLDAQEALHYLDALGTWRDQRRAELDRLDEAALAGPDPDAFTADILLSMALWKAVADRHDLLLATWDSGRVGVRERERLSTLVWGRLDTSLDPRLAGAATSNGVPGSGSALAVSLPEACRLSDALAASLRVRLSVDPAERRRRPRGSGRCGPRSSGSATSRRSSRPGTPATGPTGCCAGSTPGSPTSPRGCSAAPTSAACSAPSRGRPRWPSATSSWAPPTAARTPRTRPGPARCAPSSRPAGRRCATWPPAAWLRCTRLPASPSPTWPRSGRCPTAPDAVDAYLARLETVGRAMTLAQAAYAGALERRDELSGRLEAYRAKAAGTAALRSGAPRATRRPGRALPPGPRGPGPRPRRPDPRRGAARGIPGLSGQRARAPGPGRDPMTTHACTQPGCTGQIVDGYCDICGSPPSLLPPGPDGAPTGAPNGAPNGDPGSGRQRVRARTSTGRGRRLTLDRLAAPPTAWPPPPSGRPGRPAAAAASPAGSAPPPPGCAARGSAPASPPSRRSPRSTRPRRSSRTPRSPRTSGSARPAAPPVGRSRDGQPGRTEGFCAQCRNPFSFNPKLQAGDLVGGQYEVAGVPRPRRARLDLPRPRPQRLRPLGRAQGPAQLRRPRRRGRRDRRAAVPGPGRAPAHRRDLQLRHARGRRLHRHGVRRRHLAEGAAEAADAGGRRALRPAAGRPGHRLRHRDPAGVPVPARHGPGLLRLQAGQHHPGRRRGQADRPRRGPPPRRPRLRRSTAPSATRRPRCPGSAPRWPRTSTRSAAR